MTDQEKEEDYELHLYIITFMSEDIPTEDTSKIQQTIRPQPLQIESAPIEHQVVVPIEQSTIPTHQREGGEEIKEDTKENTPEYAMTKENSKRNSSLKEKENKSGKREVEASAYPV